MKQFFVLIFLIALIGISSSCTSYLNYPISYEGTLTNLTIHKYNEDMVTCKATIIFDGEVLYPEVQIMSGGLEKTKLGSHYVLYRIEAQQDVSFESLFSGSTSKTLYLLVEK